MSRSLIIHAEVASTSWIFLLDVAMGLREHRLLPRTMIWTVDNFGKVKLWLAISPDRESCLPGLIERFQRIPGMSKIEVVDCEMRLALDAST